MKAEELKVLANKVDKWLENQSIATTRLNIRRAVDSITDWKVQLSNYELTRIYNIIRRG